MSRRQTVNKVATGAALAASAAVLGGAGVSPVSAGQAGPTTTVSCRVDSNGSQAMRIQTMGLEPSTTHETLLLAGDLYHIDGVEFTADTSGTLATPWFGPPKDPPFSISWVVYDDTNANGRWNHDVDRTYYRGDGQLTACPQTTTLSPK